MANGQPWVGLKTELPHLVVGTSRAFSVAIGFPENYSRRLSIFEFSRSRVIRYGGQSATGHVRYAAEDRRSPAEDKNGAD
jgi:hypothetical protein